MALVLERVQQVLVERLRLELRRLDVRVEVLQHSLPHPVGEVGRIDIEHIRRLPRCELREHGGLVVTGDRGVVDLDVRVRRLEVADHLRELRFLGRRDLPPVQRDGPRRRGRRSCAGHPGLGSSGLDRGHNCGDCKQRRNHESFTHSSPSSSISGNGNRAFPLGHGATPIRAFDSHEVGRESYTFKR